MAIITIPTSIGGITIPGAVAKGPLGALFGNKSASLLQYPRDLGSATRGHVVQFFINEIQPATFDAKGNPEINFAGVETSVLGNLASTALDASYNGTAKENTANLSLKPTQKKMVGCISLYFPDTVNFQYNAGYNSLSLMSVLDSAVNLVGSATKSRKGVTALSAIGSGASGITSFAQSGANKLGLRAEGLALNPQQQLLFDGINFRSYQMAFTFTPYSKQEADTVAEIIKMFKKHAAPRLVTGGFGMFFVPPSTFDVKFLFNNAENTKINRIAESVIESIDVNYAPNGYSTTTDGSPVQTTLTINFKEIELITRDKIEDGF